MNTLFIRLIVLTNTKAPTRGFFNSDTAVIAVVLCSDDVPDDRPKSNVYVMITSSDDYNSNHNLEIL